MNKTVSSFLQDESSSLALGARLAKTLAPGMVIYLEGNLGAGKTTLVRGLLRSLGYSGIVKSPTYTLVEHYIVPGFVIYHWDLYRVNGPSELNALGQSDFFDGVAIHCIEWPEKGEGCMGCPDLTCQLQFEQTGRKATFTSHTPMGHDALLQLCADRKNA